MLNMVKPSSDFLLTAPKGASFVDPFCYLCFTFAFIILSFLFLSAL